MRNGNVEHTQKSITYTQNNLDNNNISLSDIWPQIKFLLADGISLIPVRDKDHGDKKAKSPCMVSWKPQQTERMTEAELWEAMNQYDTTAIGVVCGEISGRLELIDIDSKYKPGIEALLIKDIEKLYPEIFPKIRIHATPSGGRHIIYRIEDHDVEGNLKLAGRYATDDEVKDQLKAGKKRLSKTINFLETRGEGGYFLYPPSLGYSVVQDVPIPLITWEERCGLINLCRSYDEVIKVAPTPQPTKSQNDYYTTNPFEDFNNTCDPIKLMEEYGWKYLKDNARFIWFTRPGKDNGVSASWHHEKRVFFIFTSSTDLNNERGYNPATLLAEFGFAGDKKKAFRYLVDKGYGQIKPRVERAIIAKAINEKKSGPANLSTEAKESIKAGIERSNVVHPFGEFWKIDDGISIHLSDVIFVLKGLGFCDHLGRLCKFNFDTRIVSNCEDELNNLIDSLRDYVKIEDSNLLDDIYNSIEEKLSTKVKYIRSRLPRMDMKCILADKASVAYKCYTNCILAISADGVKQLGYEWLKGQDLFVFDSQIQQREYFFDQPSSDLYKTYLTNATRYTDHVKNCLGYLAHKKKVKDRAYLIILTEEVPNIKDGGGSGKNVFTGSLSWTTTVHEVDGAIVKTDEKMLQSWNGQNIFVMSDLRKNFYWPMLKNPVSDNMTIKKLYKDESSIPFELSPKFVASTNFSYDISDGGLKRRARPIEFTPFYTKNGGVKKVHGKMFPDDFTAEDWMSYDEVIIECIQYHLQQDGQIDEVVLSEGGQFKQLVLKYGEDLFERISDFTDELIDDRPTGFVKNLKDEIASYFDQFQNRFQKITSFQIYELISYFAEKKGFEFSYNKRKGLNNKTNEKNWIYEFIEQDFLEP